MKHNPFWYIASYLKFFVLGPVAAVFSAMVPRNRKSIAIGAWMGRLYCDNPKYLMLYLLEHSDYQITWIGEASVKQYLPQHPNLHFAQKGSWRAFWILLRAGTWVSCQNKGEDLTHAHIYHGALCLNLWHGITIKGMGWTAPASRVKLERNRRTLIHWLVFWMLELSPDWTSVSNEKMAQIMVESFPTFFSTAQLLRCGLPRNDFLINNKGNEGLIETLKVKYGRMFGFDPTKRVVLYLPTWRINRTGIFAFYDLPIEIRKQVRSLLESQSAVLVEKHHVRTYKTKPIPAVSDVSVVVTPEALPMVDTQELLLVADVLICDYSSAYIDFSLLGRPCIHYAADQDEYASDSGLVYNYSDVVAGRIVTTPTELLEELKLQLTTPKVVRGPEWKSLVEFERGGACSGILDLINRSSRA